MTYYHGPTDDPLRDADNYDRDQSAWLASRPVCHSCGEPIQSETCFAPNGQKYCYSCGEECWNDIKHLFIVETMD
jgi:hypothetical protein